MLLDHTVFAAAAAAGATKIVFASSACVYPTNLQTDKDSRLLLREADANFEEPGKAFADGEYGWAKLMGELQLRAFCKQFGLSGIACRIFTAYGERENESHAVIALIAKAAARLDPFPIWGDGLQTRNFTYVQDTVTGMALGGAVLDGFDVINVGTELTTQFWTYWKRSSALSTGGPRHRKAARQTGGSEKPSRRRQQVPRTAGLGALLHPARGRGAHHHLVSRRLRAARCANH